MCINMAVDWDIIRPN